MNRLKNIIAIHIEQNFPKYILATAVLLIGMIAGLLCSSGLTEETKAQVGGEISAACQAVREGGVDAFAVLKVSVQKNVRDALFIYLASFTVYCMPLALGVLFVRGFTAGFTLGYMSSAFGFSGVFMTAVSVLPSLLIAIPVLIMLSVLSFNNGLERKRRPAIGADQARFTCCYLLIASALLVAVLLDAAVVPEFVIQISESVQS